MKLYSIHDIPNGKDASVFFEGNSDGFTGARVRYFGRGASSDKRSPMLEQELLVIMQGKANIVVNGVMHPVAAGDFMILGGQDVFQIVADEVNPAVVLTVNTKAKPAPRSGRYSDDHEPGIETQIMGPD